MANQVLHLSNVFLNTIFLKTVCETQSTFGNLVDSLSNFHHEKREAIA